MSESGRPRSAGIRLKTSRARGVNSLMRAERSRKMVPISVELIRFWMSSLAWICSSILIFSSWLTVVQLLVDRLQLLLARLELLGRRAELLVHRLELFVRGLQLLGLGFVLLDGRAQLRLDAPDLLFELAGGIVAPDPRRRHWLRLTARPAASPRTITRKNPRAGSPSRSTGRTSRLSDDRPVVHSDAQTPGLDVGPLLRGLVQRRPQLEPQLRTDRLQQVVRRLAAGELQIACPARSERWTMSWSSVTTIDGGAYCSSSR